MSTLDITALLARNRALYGDAVMTHGDGEGSAGDAGTAGGDAAGTGTAGTAGAGDTSSTAGAATTATEVKDLPDWAQKLIAETRKEAGDHRAAAKTAADTATKELTDRLAEALGLKDATDPAKLLEQANAEKTATAAQLLSLRREVAAQNAASTAGANATLLLDSSTFRTALDALDPADKTFQANLTALVKTTLEAQPHLKAARAAGASGVDMTGGSGEPTQITDPAVIKAMTAEERVEALNKGQLRAYMAS